MPRPTAPPTARRLENWTPEDPAFWSATGARVARRNLTASIFSEHLGFSVWSLWSVLVLFMVPANGFHFDAAQKFLLVSLVTLVGSMLRVPYTLAVPRFGGRNWTVVTTFALVVPTLLGAWLIARPSAPYGLFLLVAAVAGIGGGSFSSSMTNINLFYPERRKGWALGLNAGGGNLGVATVQLVGLAVIGLAGVASGSYLPLVYVPFILVAGFCATRYMNNIAGVRFEPRAQFAVLRDRHSWIMSVLYIGTFGSFIGYGFAFGLVLQNQFGQTPPQAAALTFLGPLLGSLSRPLGGKLSDRLGGAKVTLWTFLAMIAGTAVILAAAGQASLPLFVTGFVAVFVLTGIGNGSTYKMIPSIFAAQAEDRVATGTARDEAAAWARRQSGSLIGLCGAFGAFGGVLINLAFRQSYASAASASPAFAGFLVFYVLCAGLTYAAYLRRPAAARAPVEDGADLTSA